MPMIHRVKINRLNPDLSVTQVMSFRMAGDQAYAESFGELLRTRWMELNPGHATTMVTDWPTSEELGGKCNPAARGEHFYPNLRENS